MNRQISFLIFISLVLLSSCATSISDTSGCITGHIYGFWGGLWHGLIAPFGLLSSLFNTDTYMFAPNNNGGWYALGFLFGSGGWGVMASKSASKKQTRP